MKKMKNDENLEETVQKEMPENFSARRSRNNHGLIYDHNSDTISRGGSSNSSEYGFSGRSISGGGYSIDERSGSDYLI